MAIQERYNPKPVSAGTTTLPPGCTGLGGFLCVSSTSGTLTVTRADSTVLVNALPVTAGIYYHMPFLVGEGATVTLSNCTGTLGYQ